MKFYIRELRERRGFSYDRLSKESGIARSYIQRLESNDDNVNPSARVLCKLAKALDVPIERLFDCD